VARRMAVAGVLLILLAASQPITVSGQTSSPANGTIRGRVLDSAGQPLADAEVSLQRIAENPDAGGRWTTRTSSTGEFSFDALSPGRYRVIATKPGYAARPFQPSGLFDTGRDLELSREQTLVGVDIALPRTGTVAGRVTDENGQPVAGAEVSAEMRVGDRLVGVQRPSQTNSAGEYQFGVEPGEYFVRARASRLRKMIGPWVSSEFQEYEATWYPGVTDDTQARTVRVNPDQTTSGIDIRLSLAHRVAVSGFVQDASGRVPEGTTVSHYQRQPGGGASRGTQFRFPETGAFNFLAAASTPIILVARAQTDAGRLVDIATVNVGVSPIADVRLVLQPGARLAGRLIVEGNLPPLARPLRVAAPLPGIGPVSPTGPDDGADVKSDGTFEIDGLRGERVVQVLNLPVGWTVRRIEHDSTDVTQTPLRLDPGQLVRDVIITIAPAP
jgi:hypothetical protein